MTSDGELLRRYTETNSEDAFAELARRHLDLVYCAALRQVNGDAHLAQEVTQSVFADLARKAASLVGRQALAGWLYTGAHYAAAKAVRAEQRRHTREQEAHAMQELLHEPGANSDWETLRPVLDTAMHELNEADREVILLRYFENRPHADIGEQFGLSENAARMRVERALEKLRTVLSRRGVTTTAVALSAAVSANAISGVPAGLAATLSTAALTGTTLTTTATAIKATVVTTLQKTFIAATVVAAVGMALYAFYLGGEIRSLRLQRSLLAEQVDQLSWNRDDLGNQLASFQQENERLRREVKDMPRLRAEVARLRQQPQVTPVTAQSETNSPTIMENVQIQTTAKFVSMPTEDLKELGVAWTANAQGGRSGILTEEQFKVLNEAMQEASDVNIMGVPRISNLNGGQGRISQTRAVQVDGTNANVGVSLNVTSFFSTNTSTFDLHLIAELTQLVGDASQPTVQITQTTNRSSLLPGQILVLEKEIPNGGWLPDSTNISAGPRSLLVFVTPKVVDDRGLPTDASVTKAEFRLK